MPLDSETPSIPPCNICSEKTLFIGAAVAIFFGWLILCGCQYTVECQKPLSHTGISAIEYMLNRYQTLLTGFLALYVGFMTVRAIDKQIKTELLSRSQSEKKRLKGKTRVFEQAVFNYIGTITAFIQIVKEQPSNTPSEDGMRPLVTTVKKIMWRSVAPKIPDILTDWNYLSDLADEDIIATTEIRTRLVGISGILTTLLERHLHEVNGEPEDLAIANNSWDEFIRLFTQEDKKIDGLLSNLSHRRV